jgi:YD repeat-containing protein
MNYKKLTVSFALFLLVCFKLEAQELPKILLPSPQSQQFFKQFEFPANNPNGTINYSIPIYEVKCGSLSLPISLSYVSGGTKMYDDPGEIGRNWSLNAGGRISRTIYGKPDYNMSDSVPTINNNDGSITNFEIRNYVTNVYDPGHAWDAEPDIYSYSFGNTSGKFLYTQDFATGYDFKPYLIPEKPYKIIVGGTRWTIVDDTGITYNYETYEQFSTTGSVNFGAITARHLNSIISADKKDTIRIDYEPRFQACNSQTAMSMVRDNNTATDVNIGSPGNYNYTGLNYIGETYSSNYNTYVTMVPKNIYFKGGKITFNDGIEYIKIYDKNNNLVKQIQLVKGGNDHLSELRFKDINANTVEKYSFEYYPFPTGNQYQRPDYLGYLKSNGMHVVQEHIDAGFYYREWSEEWQCWSSGEGYYNGYGYNKGIYTPDGYASDQASMIGMLKKVTFPTGGSAEYTYGDNMASTIAGLGTPSGGMRLAEAKLTDNNGNVHYKTYKYGVNGEEGFGAYKGFYVSNTYGPNPEYTSYETRVFPSWEIEYFNPYIKGPQSYRKRVYTSTFLPEIAEAAQEPTLYPTVTVYDGTPSNNTGKTVYKYHSGSKYQSYSYPLADWSGFLNSYSGYYGEHGMEFDPALSHRYHITEFHPWKSHPLESTTVFKNNGSGYDIVKTVVNNYNIVETQRFKGLHVLKNVETIPNIFTLEDAERIPIFLYDNYYITNGREELQSTTETLYTPTGNIATTTEYEYNSNLQVNKVTRTESKGGTKITTYAYPTDFATTQPYTKMVENNMVAPVIEESNYKNEVSAGNYLQSNKTDYKFWSNGQTTTTPNNSIYPKTVSSKTGASNYDARLQYHSYDSEGNITAVSKESDVVKSYIWGYNKTYPVAEVVGVSYDNALALLDQGLIQNPTSDAALRAELNKIRTTYPSAQVTTYTYKPLVGTTSATDPNNRTTYYHYDEYGRLILIRDNDYNVIKKHCYNYAGQQEGCTVYLSQVVDGNYTKQSGCPPGQVGAPYPVYLPEGSFVSTSSQLAANNLAEQYAQSLANANGTCTAPQVTLELSNYTGNYYYVGLTNTQTNESYGTWLFAYEYYIPLDVPEGTYNIYVSFDTQPDPAYIGACGYSTYGVDATFFNVTVNYQNRYITMQY